MSEEPRAGMRLLRLVLIVGVMAACVWIVGERLRARSAHAELEPPRKPVLERIREHQPHARQLLVATEKSVDTVSRDLKLVYARRAYPGAPPLIPHELATTGTLGVLRRRTG